MRGTLCNSQTDKSGDTGRTQAMDAKLSGLPRLQSFPTNSLRHVNTFEDCRRLMAKIRLQQMNAASWCHFIAVLLYLVEADSDARQRLTVPR